MCGPGWIGMVQWEAFALCLMNRLGKAVEYITAITTSMCRRPPVWLAH
jgi:hypothetical protein